MLYNSPVYLQQRVTCQCALQLSWISSSVSLANVTTLLCISSVILANTTLLCISSSVSYLPMCSTTLLCISRVVSLANVLYNSPVYLQQRVTCQCALQLSWISSSCVILANVLYNSPGISSSILANVLYNSPVYLQQRVILANVLYNSPVYLQQRVIHCQV